MWNFSRKLEFSKNAEEEAKKESFELRGYQILAAPEALRPPRIVRIGAIQNRIILPTTAPIDKQVWEK